MCESCVFFIYLVVVFVMLFFVFLYVCDVVVYVVIVVLFICVICYASYRVSYVFSFSCFNGVCLMCFPLYVSCVLFCVLLLCRCFRFPYYCHLCFYVFIVHVVLMFLFSYLIIYLFDFYTLK